MKTIGLTGGIGSGKSLVCLVFKSFGIASFNADYYAKKVYDEFPETVETLKNRYGDSVVHAGKVDRKALADIVFKSEQELEYLNRLVHPYVKIQFQNWLKTQHSPYVIREAAILFESGTDSDCDAVILVSAPEELRIQRTMKRDSLSAEEVKWRISKQWPEEKKRALSQFAILNDDIHAVLPQALDIHNTILRG